MGGCRTTRLSPYFNAAAQRERQRPDRRDNAALRAERDETTIAIHEER